MAYSRPENVGELIDLLKTYPREHRLCFSHGFTLFQVKDRGDEASFEFNETIGGDGQLVRHQDVST